MEPHCPAALWSEDEVAAWLHTSKALARYAEVFTENGINGKLLLSLSEDELCELGVANKFHRARLLSDIAELAKGT